MQKSKIVSIKTNPLIRILVVVVVVAIVVAVAVVLSDRVVLSGVVGR